LNNHAGGQSFSIKFYALYLTHDYLREPLYVMAHRFATAFFGGIILCLAPLSMAEAGSLGGGLIEFLATGGQMDAQAPVPRQAASPAMQAMGPNSNPVLVNPPDGHALQASIAPVQPQREIPEELRRTEVDYSGGQVGAIVVDTPHHYLYLVTAPGRAMRYGIGVGRPGFTWSGHKTISRKAEWPDWTPPPAMRLRRPDLPERMDGGPGNPLGARALYLGTSEYRIHGTTEPWTIGQNVSSGCIRMMNEDVIDLYERVKIGTSVQVL
jgi:lipoprotein-anchoring transpeptidase ErfK/SrfK